MSLNTRLKKLSPPIKDRMAKEDLKAIALKHEYSIETVKRMLAGQGTKYGYREENVKAVLSTAIDLMKSTEKAEKLEALFHPYIAA